MSGDCIVAIIIWGGIVILIFMWYMTIICDIWIIVIVPNLRFLVCLQGSAVWMPALVYLCKWDIFMKVLLKCISYLLSICYVYELACVWYVIMCPDVVGCHMGEPLYTCVYRYVFKLEWPEHMGTCFFKGGSVWHIWKFRKFRRKFRYFSDIRKLGQYDLLCTYEVIV